MNSKKWTLAIRPTGHPSAIFDITDPKKETIQTGKDTFVMAHDKDTKIVLRKKFATVFLHNGHSEASIIDLSAKTQNIVQRTCIAPCNSRSIKFVFKSGTSQRIQKEFENYCLLRTMQGVKTLEPLGYVVNTQLDYGFLFTVLSQQVIPLSAINYQQILTSQRKEFIGSTAHVLSVLHSEGITHNDPKLKNFLYKKGSSGDPIVIDLVKMNLSRNRTVIDWDLDLTSPKLQALRYDFLNFLGSSVYHGLITDMDEIRMFLKHYIKARHRISQDRDSEDASKAKPHQLEKFIDRIRYALELHPTDKNIQNLRKLYGLPPLKHPGRRKDDAAKTTDDSRRVDSAASSIDISHNGAFPTTKDAAAEPDVIADQPVLPFEQGIRTKVAIPTNQGGNTSDSPQQPESRIHGKDTEKDDGDVGVQGTS